MQTIHDRGYKKLFSNKVIFRELIETFVHEEWVKDLDFEQCEPLDKSFISDHYKETESDLIYKLKLKGQEVYIIILLEFQSTVDRFMALRVLNYITNFYMDYVESNKPIKKLPPIFPIVLYNGDQRWTASVRISDLIEHYELLGKYALHFEYFKIVEHEYTKEELLKIHNIVSTLFLTESYYDIDVLRQELYTIFQKKEDRQAISLFFNWFEQLYEHQRIDASDFQTLERVYQNVEEVYTMLETALQKERQQLKAQLKEELQEELKEELQEELQEEITRQVKEEIQEEITRQVKGDERMHVAKAMLAKGMSTALIAEITQIPEEKILRLQTEIQAEK